MIVFLVQYAGDLSEGIQADDGSMYATMVQQEADWTAFLFGKCVRKTPGNITVYLPSDTTTRRQR